ncbi:MAG TPA: hypothetical protein PKW33_17140 [Anaerolineaceae bacterium]|nr:hypothetical protein [Anaerolineaceae bacterium]HPN53325.1 hypothetical protein [Anaerolineaceae bacterium]
MTVIMLILLLMPLSASVLVLCSEKRLALHLAVRPDHQSVPGELHHHHLAADESIGNLDFVVGRRHICFDRAGAVKHACHCAGGHCAGF